MSLSCDAPGLMHDGEDVHAALAALFQRADDISSYSRVKAGSRLVQPQQAGLRDQLNADCCTFALASGDPARCTGPHNLPITYSF